MKTAMTAVLFALATPLLAQEAKSKFPLREKFPQLQFITTEELQNAKDVLVVDARNKIEYDVIHVEGAVNLLVGDMKKADLQAVRAPDDGRMLVFYCNGITCKKSYDAAEKARIWGFQNCKVYDAGIFTWAENVPERTRFFGELLNKESVQKKLMPHSVLQQQSLAPADFIKLAQSGDYKVYDVRDTKERQDFPIRLPKLAKLSMDEFVALLQKGGIQKDKILLLDNVGKQVEWLQYYLRQAGHPDYKFLLGGVERWRKEGYDNSGTLVPNAAPGK